MFVQIHTQARRGDFPHTHPQAALEVRVYSKPRWTKLAVYLGEASGSATGYWRTHPSVATGWNYRMGSVRRAFSVHLLTNKHTRECPGYQGVWD